LPETVIVDDGSENDIIESISYNAKGQREEIFFGNGTKTKYFYDEKTFRLSRIYTTKKVANVVTEFQNINYVYDAVGNITHVFDAAQETLYFGGNIIDATNNYTYDALYRLISATGRENYNNTPFYEQGAAQSLTGTAVEGYTRNFEYDVIGNMTLMQHTAMGANGTNFTKEFEYESGTNRLESCTDGTITKNYTYDVHGNLLSSDGTGFTYNLLDQLCEADLVGGGTAYYQYNAEGQRDRKKIVLSSGTKKDRAYFQNYERYRELDNADDLVLERYTHHISDGEKKVATLDQATGSNILFRYQYGNNLGSVGLELDDTAAIISYEEYYPFGGTSYYAHNHHIDVPLKRYKYCGKEQDEETGLYYYGARYYAPWLCRFTSVDPKSLEYIHQSSYVFADNNPVVKYDVNGEGTEKGGLNLFIWIKSLFSRDAKNELYRQKGYYFNKSKATGRAFKGEYNKPDDGKVIEVKLPSETYVDEGEMAGDSPKLQPPKKENLNNLAAMVSELITNPTAKITIQGSSWSEKSGDTGFATNLANERAKKAYDIFMFENNLSVNKDGNLLKGEEVLLNKVTKEPISADKIEIVDPVINDSNVLPGATIISTTTEPNPETSTPPIVNDEKKTFFEFLFSKSVSNTKPTEGKESENYKQMFLDK
jgi:RHS repeat-associated protein